MFNVRRIRIEGLIIILGSSNVGQISSILQLSSCQILHYYQSDTCLFTHALMVQQHILTQLQISKWVAFIYKLTLILIVFEIDSSAMCILYYSQKAKFVYVKYKKIICVNIYDILMFIKRPDYRVRNNLASVNAGQYITAESSHNTVNI